MNKLTPSHSVQMRAFASLAMLAFALGFSDQAAAMYKYLDTDGRVTYSDRPPPPGAKSLDANTSGAGTSLPDLPFALRGSVTRYPVSLFTLSNACAPCDDARKLLTARGVPFTERIVRGTSDTAAMKKLNLPTGQFPVITVGSQSQTNFEPIAIGALLDAAGYPKSSALPSSYRNPMAIPVAGVGSNADVEAAGSKLSVIENPRAADSAKAKPERALRPAPAAVIQQATSTIKF
jgi:glutaredoxin